MGMGIGYQQTHKNTTALTLKNTVSIDELP